LVAVQQHDAATDTVQHVTANLCVDLQARFSNQELDAAYQHLAAHGMVAASSRPGGRPQLSDRFMCSLQVYFA